MNVHKTNIKLTLKSGQVINPVAIHLGVFHGVSISLLAIDKPVSEYTILTGEKNLWYYFPKIAPNISLGEQIDTIPDNIMKALGVSMTKEILSIIEYITNSDSFSIMHSFQQWINNDSNSN